MSTKTLRSLQDILLRAIPATPWAEGDNIPWNDPAFSERMLREHLSQAHDLASRRTSIIDEHVQFIHQDLLQARPTRILDLGCGPGLYVHRLASLGHECVGIDFGPASIRHARNVAIDDRLRCRFVLSDLRQADFEDGFGLVMMLYGQLNVFRRAPDAADLLQRAFAALSPEGRILLEVQTEERLRRSAVESPTWHTSATGLFSDRPHLTLHEHFWDEEARCSTERWFVIDLESCAVTRHALSNEAYSTEELSELLRTAGFSRVETAPVLKGSPPDSGMFAVTARKG